jgi:hypothetical protein
LTTFLKNKTKNNMKKTAFIMLLLVSSITTATVVAKEKKLKETSLSYKGKKVFMNEYNRCFVIDCDTIDVTKKLKNIKYNKSK